MRDRLALCVRKWKRFLRVSCDEIPARHPDLDCQTARYYGTKPNERARFHKGSAATRYIPIMSNVSKIVHNIVYNFKVAGFDFVYIPVSIFVYKLKWGGGKLKSMLSRKYQL